MAGCAKIVFVSQRDGQEQIYSMWIDGSVQSNLSGNQFSERFPDASPDGKKIAFSSDRDGVGENIFIMDIDTGSVQQLTSGAHRKIRPQWSPQQDRIAYAGYSSGEGAAIFVKPLNGGAVIQVTRPDPDHSDSLGHAFYDNGTKVIFARVNTSQGGSGLYSKNADGTGEAVRILNTSTPATYPTISHNGQLLAYRIKGYMTGPGAPEWILVHEVGSWQKLAEFQLQAPVPGLGPNIRGITFSKEDDRLYVSARAADVASGGNNRLEIFSVKLDGSGQKRLTNNTAYDAWPSAVPLP
jgi:Tol biopolymer transport system component